LSVLLQDFNYHLQMVQDLPLTLHQNIY